MSDTITKIELTYNGSKVKGILLKEKEDEYSLKLASGYQIAISKKDASDVQTKTEEVASTNHSIEVNNDESLPNIAIFHTGGTIASKVDYATGAVSSKFTPEELINLFKELQNKANLQAFMVGNLSSEDMRFGHYNMLLENITKHAKDFDGIIISHGTDTLHYSSAALQYGIENLNIPVILVGAQRSSDRAGSDSYLNLDAAIEFITYNYNLKKQNKPTFNRVGICMHSSINDDGFYILDAINAKKMHSSRRDAFKQINFPPACEISKEYEIFNKREELFTLLPKNKISYQKYDESLRVGIFMPHPHLCKEEIESLEMYDGVILANTGLGHMGISEFDEISKYNEESFKALQKVVKKIPVCLGVQTVYGQVNLNVYSPGRKLLEIGVLGNHTGLIVETQFAKLAHLLSKHKGKKITNEMWMDDLEGFDSQRLVDLE